MVEHDWFRNKNYRVGEVNVKAEGRKFKDQKSKFKEASMIKGSRRTEPGARSAWVEARAVPPCTMHGGCG
jgi:hypothetical protein